MHFGDVLAEAQRRKYVGFQPCGGRLSPAAKAGEDARPPLDLSNFPVERLRGDAGDADVHQGAGLEVGQWVEDDNLVAG